MIQYVLKKNINEKMPNAYGKFFAYPVITQTCDTCVTCQQKKHGLNSMLFFAFIFNLVKTFTIHTDNGTLTDKGMWIYLTDKTEDSRSLALLGQHEQHLHILTGIKTAGIHHRYSPISIYIDALAYLLILLRNDKELYASSSAVYHLVDAECLNAKNYITI